MIFWLEALIGVILAFIIWEWSRSDSQGNDKPGKFYYTKKWLFRLLLILNARRKRNVSIETSQNDRSQRGYGATVIDPMLLEQCQVLETDPNAIDTTYFNGFQGDGTSLALRVARKHNREGELWVMLHLPDIGFLQHPLHPDTGVYNMGTDRFSAGGCKFEILEPMRRWKVTYSGLLRKGLCTSVSDKPETLLNVKLSLRWACLSDPFNFDVDLDHASLADAIGKEKWTSEFWQKLRGKHQTHYEQCGVLWGTVEVEGHETKHVYLRSFRDHTFGVRNWEMFERYAIHFIWIPETGIMAMVGCLWMPGYITNLKTGYLQYASGETYPVTGIDLDLKSLTEEMYPPETYSFTFTAAGITYNVDVVTTVTPEVYHYRSRTSRILERFSTFTVNGKPAHGLTEYHYRNPEGPTMEISPPSPVPLLREPALTEVESSKAEITLQFQETACQSGLLVGGKGSQLALLTSIQQQVGAVVPRGFCLTLHAFYTQLKEFPELDSALSQLEELRRNGCLDELQKSCSEVVELLSNCTVSEPIKSRVLSTIAATFGNDSLDSVSLAVRSSAAGEDGSDASSAGQMETFIGVRGQDNILKAICKCWASAFTHQAVEYRRQHGQPMKTAVGVVIQEMVQSDVAGVLFTNDPVSGSPNKMVIDASFGLGEVVVSGKTTPDTVIVQRDFDNELKIVDKQLGTKNVLIEVADGGGTLERSSHDASTKCCLSDESIINLCRIAVQVELHYGNARDIEWAMKGDQVYLLQARPITTLGQETDDELIHEFDSAVSVDTDLLTLGNIGEMMPGAVTPLTNYLFFRAVEKAVVSFQTDFGRGTVLDNADKGLMSICGRGFLNLTAIAQYACCSPLYQKNILELNLVGEVLEDHTMEQIITHGKTVTGIFQSLSCLYRLFKNGRRKLQKGNEWIEKVKTFDIGSTATTAADLHKAIDANLPIYYEGWSTGIAKSAKSGTWGGILMGIVSSGKPDWSTDNYSDVALLLSQCTDVYSAEVPAAMENIALAIVKCGVEETVTTISDQECVAYLRSKDCPCEVSEKFQTFIDRHGHRCIREAELIERSWRSEPEKLIKVIKSILKSKAYEVKRKDAISIDEALTKLKSPVTAFGKFLLKKWVVPKARISVAEREYGKSISIHIADKFKDAYWRLADMMCKEGHLPETELLFYLTHDEIGQVINTRSSKLIMRAVRRRRLLPIQTDLEFPRITRGRPEPVKQVDEEERKSTFTLKGLPVCQGSVKATARVIKSLADASNIQKGDILIVCYTDVGWTPYFPLLAGLVTEMGGLVSHGAVVAREYGLPCVVNIPGATSIIHSGDLVLLDGTAGCLHRLEE